MRGSEKLIHEVNGTMAIEGMPLTDEDRDRLRSILRGELSYEAAIRAIVDKYSRKDVKSQWV